MTADAGSALDVAGIAAVLAAHQWSHTALTLCSCGWYPARRYDSAPTAHDRWLTHVAEAVAAHVEALREADQAALAPTPDDTPAHGLDWRDGLDTIDALLNDCAQIGEDHENWVRVSAVRDIVKAVRRYEDDTDESIRQALWEDAVVNDEPWTRGDES